MIQGINLSTPVFPNPVVSFCPNNDDEAPNPVPDVFSNKPPSLELVDESVKPVEAMVSFLHSVSWTSSASSCLQKKQTTFLINIYRSCTKTWIRLRRLARMNRNDSTHFEYIVHEWCESRLLSSDISTWSLVELIQLWTSLSLMKLHWIARKCITGRKSK